MEQIPPDANVDWAIAAFIFMQKENKLQAKKFLAQDWRGQSLEVLIQATPQELEEIPKQIIINEGVSLRVMVERSKLRCLKCGPKRPH